MQKVSQNMDCMTVKFKLVIGYFCLVQWLQSSWLFHADILNRAFISLIEQLICLKRTISPSIYLWGSQQEELIKKMLEIQSCYH